MCYQSVQKSKLQIQTSLSSLKRLIAFQVYQGCRSTPTILLCFFLIYSTIVPRGLPVPQPTSRKLPEDRFISLIKLRCAAIVKKQLMNRSQMQAESCLANFNIRFIFFIVIKLLMRMQLPQSQQQIANNLQQITSVVLNFSKRRTSDLENSQKPAQNWVPSTLARSTPSKASKNIQLYYPLFKFNQSPPTN